MTKKVERYQVLCPDGVTRGPFHETTDEAQEYAEWGHACMTAEDHTLLTLDVPICDWFIDCENLSPQAVEHPTLGLVGCCDEHIAWLGSNPSPTQFVPPLVAQNLSDDYKEMTG